MSGISNRLRDKLNEYAPMYYRAKKSGNKEKSDKAFREMGFDTAGFDTLGSGSGRIVVDLDICGFSNLVAKIAIPHSKYDGRDQNKREAELWKNSSSEEQKYLVKVVEYDPDRYWLIMKKGKDKNQYSYEWKKEVEYVLKNVIWDEDIRDENIVEVDGKYKLCDYGTPK